MTIGKEPTDRQKDHTKTIVVTVSLVLICGGLVGSGWMALQSIGAQFATPGNITATEPAQAGLMAEVSPSPEPTATSTPDGSIPTQQALLNQVATAQAENNRLQEQIRQINLEAQALETRNVEAQAAIAKAEADKARASADKAAQDAIIADAKVREIAESNRTKDVEAKSLMATAEIKQAETADNMQWIIGGAVIGFLILGTIAMFRNRPQPEPVTETGEGDDKPKAEPMVAHLHTDAGATKRIVNPPATEAVFRNWAEHVTTGDSAAIDEWETKESPFKGRQYRDYFYPWLIKNNMLTSGTDNRRVLSNIGADYCREWLARHAPPSPIELTTPNNAPTATVHTENGHGSAEGGSGADETKGQKE